MALSVVVVLALVLGLLGRLGLGAQLLLIGGRLGAVGRNVAVGRGRGRRDGRVGRLFTREMRPKTSG